jgi:hypothetical protein
MIPDVAALSDVIFVARASAATPGKASPTALPPPGFASLYPGYGT